MYTLSFVPLLEKGIDSAESMARAWDDLYRDILVGGSVSGDVLYSTLVRLGEAAAVGTILFLLLFLFKELEQGKMDAFEQMIWPVIVAVLLSANGTILGSLTLDVHNVVNDLNQEVQRSVHTGVRLDEAYRSAKNLSNFQAVIGGYIRQCESLTGEQQLECLERALDDTETLLNSWQAVMSRPADWIADRLDDIGAIRQKWRDEPGSFFTPNSPIYWTLFGPAWEPVAYSLLWAFQIAFQQMVEISMLLTAILGPLALGGSLIPVAWRAKPVFAWLTGFFSLGILKLGFNIIVGLAATIFVSSDSTDPLFFPMFLALFAPILASFIAGLGGLAVWSSLTSIATMTLSLPFILKAKS